MLTEKINEALEVNRSEEKTRDYVGASEIGHPCLRKVWYSYHLQQARRSIPPKLLLTFEIGHYIERMVIDLLQKSKLTVLRDMPVEDVKLPIKGHVDAFLIDGNGEVHIIEIKSACNAQFNIFKSKGLVGWKMQYYAQVQAYMGINKVNNATLIAVNKDTAELHEESVTFEPDYYGRLLERAETVINSDEPPERINKNPCFFICKMCSFARVCHE